MDQATPEISPSIEPKKSGNQAILIVVLLIVLVGILYAAKKYLLPNASQSFSSSTTSETSSATTINISGKSYTFDPSQITVKVNQPVKIVFHNTDGFHNITIDDFNVKSESIGANQSTTVEFTPTKTGTFKFYCSVPGHADRGMMGTLTVE